MEAAATVLLPDSHGTACRSPSAGSLGGLGRPQSGYPSVPNAQCRRGASHPFFIPAPSLCLHRTETVEPAPADRVSWSCPSLEDPPKRVFNMATEPALPAHRRAGKQFHLKNPVIILDIIGMSYMDIYTYIKRDVRLTFLHQLYERRPLVKQ